MPTIPTFAPPANAVLVRVSDSEREFTVGVLRENWVDGRLTLAELEERTQEAFGARYPGDLWRAVRELPVPSAPAPPPVANNRNGQAAWAVVFSSVGALMLLFSMGLLFIFSLPLSAAGWGMGREVRRDERVTRGKGVALSGEVLGAIGTVSACLALTACAATIAGG